MKFKLLLICCVLSDTTVASCISGLYLYPEGNAVVQNPVFLIELVNVNPVISQNLTNFDFKIVSKRHGVIAVEFLDVIKQNGFVKQMLFRPAQLLEPSDSIRLQLKHPALLLSAEELSEIERFFRGIKYQQWLVTEQKDTTAPEWGEAPLKWTYFREDANASNAPNQMIFVQFSTLDKEDSSYARKGDKRSFPQQRLLLAVLNERRFYYVDRGESVSITDGVCRSDFTLAHNHSYQVTLTPMDFSGNYCPESKILVFNTFSE